MTTKAMDKAQSSFKLNPMDELNDLRMSEKALPLLEHVKRFIAETAEEYSLLYGLGAVAVLVVGVLAYKLIR